MNGQQRVLLIRDAGGWVAVTGGQIVATGERKQDVRQAVQAERERTAGVLA